MPRRPQWQYSVIMRPSVADLMGCGRLLIDSRGMASETRPSTESSSTWTCDSSVLVVDITESSEEEEAQSPMSVVNQQ